jgi:CRISPR-associated protein Csx10
MRTITFLLHTLQPVLATSLQGDPNSDISYSYIPGSLIRGVLIGRYLQQHRIPLADDILDQSHPHYLKVQQLFFDGRTRYLNAYLFDFDQEMRVLPIPRSWFKEKGKQSDDPRGLNVYDFSYEKPSQDISLKSLDEKFCIVTDNEVKLYKEKRRINIHNKRDRRVGRGIEGRGAVFRYEAIDTGQTFQAVILCDEDDNADQILNLLEPDSQNKAKSQEIWLGGSQSAGYGRCRIEQERIQNLSTWHEIAAEPEDRSDSQQIRITLLSDLILRDCCGQNVAIPPTSSASDTKQQSANPITQLLEDLLAVKLQPKASYTSSLIVGGFNRKWGLPLPQTPALAAGSVFVFQVDHPLDPDHICALEAQGIGERRIDGFGRVAINWLRNYSKYNATLASSEIDQTKPKLEEESESSQRAKEMVKRLLEQQLEKKLLEVVDNIQFQPNKMRNSQLSRLIIVTREAFDAPDSSPVIKLLESLTKTASDQYKQTRVNGKSFDEKIRDWLNGKDAWISSQDLNVSVAGETISTELIDVLKLKYTLQLIMFVAKQASKRNRHE